jgi:hypothetical protein
LLPVVFLLRTAIYGGIFVGANISVALLSHLSMPEAPLPGLATFNPGNLLFFVAVALATNFVFLLRGLLGGRMLILPDAGQSALVPVAGCEISQSLPGEGRGSDAFPSDVMWPSTRPERQHLA